MRSFNQVVLLGNLTADPTFKEINNGNDVANFTVVTNYSWQDKNTGEWKERGEYTRCVVFGKAAGICDEYLHKGQQVFVTGRLQTRKFTKDNVDRYTTEVIVNEFYMTGNKPRNEERPHMNGHQQQEFPDDEIPF